MGDYPGYLHEWKAVLGGRDPWLDTGNAYGPLFNVLSPLVWINPRANKLFFAFSYLAYLIWLVKDFAPRRGLVALSWPLSGLWLLNPFPWVVIAYFGYFDVLVALACVAAVHNVIGRKDGISGTCLALGILLKYMPIVVLPFLVFGERRLHFRLLNFCVGVVIFGFIVSVLVWGMSTFLPLAIATTRPSHWSIYDALAASHSLPSDGSNLDPFVWLERPLLVTAGLGTFVWCMLRQSGPAISAVLAVSVTLLFYRTGYIAYQMVPFVLNLVLGIFRVAAVGRTSYSGDVIGRLFRLARHFGVCPLGSSFHNYRRPFLPLYPNVQISLRLCIACRLGSLQFSAGRYHS